MIVAMVLWMMIVVLVVMMMVMVTMILPLLMRHGDEDVECGGKYETDDDDDVDGRKHENDAYNQSCYFLNIS